MTNLIAKPIGRRPSGRPNSPRPLTEGERWTAAALFDLREKRYRPQAWYEFVRVSLRRAAESRQARPELARQARRWGAFGAGAWLMACRLGDRRHNVSLNRTAGLLWWAAVWQMLDWHLGMAEGGDGCRRRRLSAADAATLTRFWLVPLVLGVRRTRVGFPTVITLGGLSDLIDGSLARRHGRTRLGRDLDTTADLAFLGSAAVAATRVGRLPPFAAYAVAGRYLSGTALALAASFGRARRPAVKARSWSAAIRVGGLAVAAAGGERLGTALLLVGCLVPPRSTAPERSAA